MRTIIMITILFIAEFAAAKFSIEYPERMWVVVMVGLMLSVLGDICSLYVKIREDQ